MNPCDTHHLEKLLVECCSMNPQTGESILQQMDDGTVQDTCPNVLPNGICSNYENRPDPCKSRQCHAFYQIDLFDMFYRE